MGKKNALFKDGQHVFAKVKGYSPWPAKVSKRRENVERDVETGNNFWRIFVFISFKSPRLNQNQVKFN